MNDGHNRARNMVTGAQIVTKRNYDDITSRGCFLCKIWPCLSPMFAASSSSYLCTYKISGRSDHKQSHSVLKTTPRGTYDVITSWRYCVAITLFIQINARASYLCTYKISGRSDQKQSHCDVKTTPRGTDVITSRRCCVADFFHIIW